MHTNNYSNKERFDKVIAKIKWCSFFCLTVMVLTDEDKSAIKF